MCLIGANASGGEAGTVSDRLSTRRVPKRTPPQLRAFPEDDSASDHRVSATCRSSFRIAAAMASLTPMGRIGKASDAAGSLTTLALRRLSISFRPTRAYRGVTSPNHRLDRRGVSTGTGSITRRSPRNLEYSRINSP